ncbi:hypothetical protein LGM46_29820 [Burkholderia arboris]|nr:hypothetical protein [Burkholderia arboris]
MRDAIRVGDARHGTAQVLSENRRQACGVGWLNGGNQPPGGGLVVADMDVAPGRIKPVLLLGLAFRRRVLLRAAANATLSPVFRRAVFRIASIAMAVNTTRFGMSRMRL